MGRFSRKQWPLATKLTITMTGLVILAVASVTLLSLRREQQTFKQELEHQAEILLNTLVVTVSDPLYFLNIDFIEELMAGLSEDEILVSGRIYEKEGRLIAKAYDDNLLTYSTKPDPFGQKLLQSTEIVFYWEKHQLLAGKAVKVGNQSLGAVSVGLSTAPLQQKIAVMRNQGILVALIAASVSTILALLLNQSITRPLKQMTEATQRLASGDLTQKLEISSNDELAVLANAFNRMTSQLQTLINSLEQRAEALHQSGVLLTQKVQQEALINKLSKQIRNSFDLDTILETALQAIYNLLQIDQCQFFWYTSQPNPVWDCVKEAKNPELPTGLGKYPVAENDPFGKEIFNLQIIRLSNTVEVNDPIKQQLYFSWGSTAILALPIVTKSRKIGVVCCRQFSSPRDWQDSEVELLSAVCDQLAIAISQAELFHQATSAADMAQERASQLEQALQTLKRTQSQLIQSEKMASLGQFVAGVAHEINNPISFIYGNIAPAQEYAADFLHLLALYQQHHPNPAPEIRQAAEDMSLEFLIQDFPKLLSSMKMGAERISEIVESLRSFSYQDQAEMKLVDLHEGINNTLLILKNSLKAKANHPAIKVIKEYGKLPKIECYSGKMNQVFMNIIANAIDALDDYNQQRTPEQIELEPSTIRITTAFTESETVVISIKDNGPGIPCEVQQKMFNPFFTTKPVGKGTGLGMYISYQIVVERHRGQLKCNSLPGQGAEFVIEIPGYQD
ncbi:MAG: HAMP domain-containing protein [Symploca sp. SIO2E9]|nr:HAMP domain-containing protein [Symploca sp. SIO2E9]